MNNPIQFNSASCCHNIRIPLQRSDSSHKRIRPFTTNTRSGRRYTANCRTKLVRFLYNSATSSHRLLCLRLQLLWCSVCAWAKHFLIYFFFLFFLSFFPPIRIFFCCCVVAPILFSIHSLVARCIVYELALCAPPIPPHSTPIHIHSRAQLRFSSTQHSTRHSTLCVWLLAEQRNKQNILFIYISQFVLRPSVVRKFLSTAECMFDGAIAIVVTLRFVPFRCD